MFASVVDVRDTEIISRVSACKQFEGKGILAVRKLGISQNHTPQKLSQKIGRENPGEWLPLLLLEDRRQISNRQGLHSISQGVSFSGWSFPVLVGFQIPSWGLLKDWLFFLLLHQCVSVASSVMVRFFCCDLWDSFFFQEKNWPLSNLKAGNKSYSHQKMTIRTSREF